MGRMLRWDWLRVVWVGMTICRVQITVWSQALLLWIMGVPRNG